MTVHQEMIAWVIVLMFCFIGCYATMIDITRIHRVFKDPIMYAPTKARKIAIVCFCAGALLAMMRVHWIAP